MTTNSISFYNEMLGRALQKGLLVEENFLTLAAVCNCSLEYVQGFATATKAIQIQKQESQVLVHTPFVDHIGPRKLVVKVASSEDIAAVRKRKRNGLSEAVKKNKKRKLDGGEYIPVEMPTKAESPRPKTQEKVSNSKPKRARRKNQKNQTQPFNRVRLFCAHCSQFFHAKPTRRGNLFVLNHQCNGDKRKQFVVGRHHRRCKYDHPQEVACIALAPESNALEPTQVSDSQHEPFLDQLFRTSNCGLRSEAL